MFTLKNLKYVFLLCVGVIYACIGCARHPYFYEISFKDPCKIGVMKEYANANQEDAIIHDSKGVYRENYGSNPLTGLIEVKRDEKSMYFIWGDSGSEKNIEIYSTCDNMLKWKWPPIPFDSLISEISDKTDNNWHIGFFGTTANRDFILSSISLDTLGHYWHKTLPTEIYRKWLSRVQLSTNTNSFNAAIGNGKLLKTTVETSNYLDEYKTIVLKPVVFSDLSNINSIQVVKNTGWKNFTGWTCLILGSLCSIPYFAETEPINKSADVPVLTLGAIFAAGGLFALLWPSPEPINLYGKP